MKIIEQGAPLVNTATVVYQSDEVVLIEIDMDSKYCKCSGYSDKEFWICADSESMHLSEDHDVNDHTMIELDEIPGNFYVFSIQSTRYTISVALKKKDW